tara:strand:+ start:626 stop:847 length:222 start_codon:yes stop_codon:yes gene_type:complete
MSMRVLEEMEREHESHICSCCLEQVVDIVLGTEDEDGLEDRIELIHRTMYDLWDGLMERVKLLETKLKRLEVK